MDPAPAGQSSAMFANPGRAAALFCRVAGLPKGETGKVGTVKVVGASCISPTCSYKEKKSPLLTCVFCLVIWGNHDPPQRLALTVVGGGCLCWWWCWLLVVVGCWLLLVGRLVGW